MNVTDVAALQLGALDVNGATRAASPWLSGPRPDMGTSASGFASALERARDAARPQGAAANSQATDLDHASRSSQTIDRSSRLYEQCRELETFLVKNMLKSMRSTVEEGGLVEEGFAGQMYNDMLYDEYAASLARNGGFGLADQAYLQLCRTDLMA